MNDIVSIARNKLVEFIGTITKNIVCQNLYQAAFYKESSLKRYIGRNIFLRVNILTILDSPLGAYKYESSNSINGVFIFCDFTIRDPRNFMLYSQALFLLIGIIWHVHLPRLNSNSTL